MLGGWRQRNGPGLTAVQLALRNTGYNFEAAGLLNDHPDRSRRFEASRGLARYDDHRGTVSRNLV